MLSVVIADRLAGVRAAWRWVLDGQDGIAVAAEAASVAAARQAAGDVVVAGLDLVDGTAADLCADRRPVVVVSALPADERPELDLRGAAAVLRTGTLRAELAGAIRGAAR